MFSKVCNVKRLAIIVVAAGGSLACLPAQAQWGSIRANNRSEHEARAPQVISRGRAEVRPQEGRHEERRETFARPGAEVRREGHEEPFEHRRFDFDEDRRRGFFWSGITSGMYFNALPSGYVPLTVAGNPYYYYGGAYYQQEPTGYVAVNPPMGAIVPALPPGAEGISTPQGVFYYAGGAFYVQQPQGFEVVPPPFGVTVGYLPPGATPVYIRGMLYYQANGIYFMPVMQGGVTVYTTVQP